MVDSNFNADISPYAAVLLQSFGGPNGPDDVMPFLRNVVRGRGVPDERLTEVAKHYLDRGGRSPINAANLALRQALSDELDRRGIQVPVLWGNRNWEPYLVDTLRDASARDLQRIVSVVTSAYSSYSGCRQYWDDLDSAAEALRGAPGNPVPEVDRIRPYFNHPAFIRANARAVDEARRSLGDSGVGDAFRVLFVTHSIPVAMDRTSGPDGLTYQRQHRAVADAIMRELGQGQDSDRTPPAPRWDLVFSSRSGPPTQPWLEPDINDHIRTLVDEGVQAVVVAPIGFISDHMEVVYDLHVEAAQTAAECGIQMISSATVGTDPDFIAGLVDLIEERAALARGEVVDAAVMTALPALPVPCREGCCPKPVRPVTQTSGTRQ